MEVAGREQITFYLVNLHIRLVSQWVSLYRNLIRRSPVQSIDHRSRHVHERLTRGSQTQKKTIPDINEREYEIYRVYKGKEKEQI